MSHQARRALLVVVLLAGAVALVSTDAAFDRLRPLLDSLDAVILAYGEWGAVLFVVLSALSAMLAFFSTALVVPVAIEAWGKPITVLLLWAGWFLGGTLSYVIGRVTGRRVVRWFIDEQKLRTYEEWIAGNIGAGQILLFQFALPSEIPGYVLGLAAVPFRTYAMALIIAELPFAIGAVYLGESFLRRDIGLMIALGAGGLLLTLAAATLYRRRVRGPIP